MRASDHPSLTARQRTVLSYVGATGDPKEAAHRLGITRSGVQKTFDRLRHRQCGCINDAQALYRHRFELEDVR